MINNLKTPKNAKELATILGTVMYLNRFSTNLAVITALLRPLLKKGVHFSWEKHLQAALDETKKELETAMTQECYGIDPSTTERLAMELCGLLPETALGIRYVLVIAD